MTSLEQRGFRALSDPTRRNILKLLTQNDLTIAQVADNFQMTRAGVKKHLTILQEGGLVSVQVRGRERLNSLNVDGLKQVADWFGYFEVFWDGHLNALKSEIEKDIQ